MYQYKAKVNRVIDGDTVVLDIDLGMEVWLHDQHIRLANFDAPETRTRDLEEKKRGLAAKVFLQDHLPVGSDVILDSREYHGERGKYGRVLGDIQIPSSGISSIVELMKSNGHSKHEGNP